MILQIKYFSASTEDDLSTLMNQWFIDNQVKIAEGTEPQIEFYTDYSYNPSPTPDTKNYKARVMYHMDAEGMIKLMTESGDMGDM